MEVPRFPALRCAASVVLLLALFLTAGGLGYRAYLAAPEVTGVPPAPAAHPALATRAVIFLIDGFHPGRAFDPSVMPTLVGLARRGASGVVQTGPVTTTAPCIFSLTTGRPGSLVQAIFNFNSGETRVDSLLSLAAAAGFRIALAGDPAWHKQFAWLVPAEDRHESPEPGITIDPAVRLRDAGDVDFLLAKLRDPAYRLAIVHLGSADAAGHMVTPHGEAYFTVLTFLDGQLARLLGAVDLGSTVVLVTGDHGMAARGTHGGEEEARLTPYVLAGAGVKSGIVGDVPQTALTATLSGLLGLPFLPVSEYPPLVDRLAVSAEAARSLDAEYFASKRRAAVAAGTAAPADAGSPEDLVNARLNEALFGAEDLRLVPRVLVVVVSALGVLWAAFLVWRSSPITSGRPPLGGHLGLAVLPPLAMALAATAFIRARGLFEYRSESLATAIAVGLFALVALLAWGARRSSRLVTVAGRWPEAATFAGVVILSLPLVTSHWLRPAPYFAALLIGATLAIAVARRRAQSSTLHEFVWPPLAAGVLFYSPRLSASLSQETFYVPAMSAVVLGLALWRIGRAGGWGAVAARVLLCATFAGALFWRLHGGTALAAGILLLFCALLVSVGGLARHPVGAGATLIGGSAALFLVLAVDSGEAIIFLLAATAALGLLATRIDLSRPSVVCLVAALAILVRICLFFALGDQYRISSIRTSPGFVFVSTGIPLATVTTVLLVKYSLPWLLILGALAPSLAAASRPVRSHLMDLLALGYVARFALVAAVIDPSRILPNGMDGIVGLFCTSWGELVTFGMAATVVLLVSGRWSAAPVGEVARP